MLSLNLPLFPVLETQRLILRGQNESDAAALYALRTNDQVMRYIDRVRPKHVDESKAVIQTLNKNFKNGESLVWAIVLKEQPDVMIGNIGYYRTDLANHRAELGYMLLPEYWRKGIISEALVQAVNFGFDSINLHSISANINPENNASRQILIKNGFVKEAYFKQDYYVNGKFLDSEIYGLLNPNH
ncbi:GNAT family N-acetyltransferase [Pedobacter metabolipauper]|uniref:Ribosomal-protein-alanine N-acetyltransferase n=1 Tax=Pedobacter metabolipauper TaxID=425513 RepID=A0A4R6T1G5_9SPHI|nr:GNAT family N-acetyltransferase [Pedobacter metabolipauper]TDQ11181.1 ribosomal-protein-alanine N-acetyltransferase [Pedobacter metabolipauper]